MLPDTSKNADEIMRLAKVKYIDFTLIFAASKVREIVSYDVCNTLCWTLQRNKLVDQTFQAIVKHANLIDELRVDMLV